MGATDSRPQNYDIDRMHENDYMATYKHRCSTCDSVPVPGGTLQIGAKIIQDIDDRPGEYYVMHKGHRIYLTTNGDWNADAPDKLEAADGYGTGPALMFSGDPSDPVITAFGKTDQMDGDWRQMQIKNLSDLQKAVNLQHGGINAGKYAGSYGMLSVNPLKSAPKDIWTPTEFSKGLSRVGTALMEPVIETVVDDFTFGIGGSVMQLTGLSDKLSSALQKFDDSGESEITDHGWKVNKGNYDTSFSSLVKDPRLDDYYEKVKSSSFDVAKQNNNSSYAKALNTALNSRHDTGQDKIDAIRQFANLRGEMHAEKEIGTLKQTVDFLHKVVGDKVKSFDWNQIKYGLDAAQTPLQKSNVVKYFTKRLTEEVMPKAREMITSMQQQRQNQPPHQVSAPNAAPVPPKDTHSAIINGHPPPVPPVGFIMG